MTDADSSFNLGELISTQKGYAFKSNWFTDSGKPVVKVSNFTEDSIESSNLTYIPEDIASNYSQFTLHTDDIVIQTVGSWPKNPKSVVGKVIRVPPEVDGSLLNQNAVIIQPDERLDKYYLYYLFKNYSFKDYIIKCASGAANQASITLEDIRIYSFILPNLEKQKEIGKILINFDNIIRLNWNCMKKLEDISKLIYRNWFIEYKFLGNQKRNTNNIIIGKIPEGWKVEPFTNLVSINPNIEINKKAEKPYVSMAGLSKNSMKIEIESLRTGNKGTKFQNNDILFARITPSCEHGKTGFVQILKENQAGLGSTEFFIFRSQKLCPEMVYFIARTNRFRTHAIKSMTGASGRQRVNKECFEEYYYAKPENKTITLFHQIVSPLFKEINLLNRKNKILQEMRDILIPKLIIQSEC